MSSLRQYPTSSPGQRHQIRVIRKLNPNNKLNKINRLLIGLNANSGRNNAGRITVRGIGGGNKKSYRQIDWIRNIEIPGIVTGIEYDPNRSANIASVLYRSKDISKIAYIVATKNMVIGQTVMSGPTAEQIEGNSLPLNNIDVGTQICLIETNVGKGAVLCRSAGTSARIVKKEISGYAVIAMKSGIFKSVPLNCKATIGIVGNEDHSNELLGKAGVSRWKGKCPKVRGVAMNPVDHPHGGGQGKTAGGRPSVTPYGIPTKGYKTRKKPNNKFHQRNFNG